MFTHRPIPCDNVEMDENVDKLTSCAGMNGTNEYPRCQAVNLNERRRCPSSVDKTKDEEKTRGVRCIYTLDISPGSLMKLIKKSNPFIIPQSPEG